MYWRNWFMYLVRYIRPNWKFDAYKPKTTHWRINLANDQQLQR